MNLSNVLDTAIGLFFIFRPFHRRAGFGGYQELIARFIKGLRASVPLAGSTANS